MSLVQQIQEYNAGCVVDGFITNMKKPQRKKQLKNIHMKQITTVKERQGTEALESSNKTGNQNKSRDKIQKFAKDS